MKPLFIFLIITLFSGVAAADGKEHQSLSEIKETAKQFAQEYGIQQSNLPVEVKVGKIDARLRLSKCATPLEAFHSPGNRGIGSALIGVRCAKPKPWSLYVPVTIKAYADIPVASYSLPMGKRLSSDDIMIQRREISELGRGYIDSSERIIGHITRRPIPRGSVFTPSAIKRDLVVKRGQKITIIAKNSGFSVKAQGEAQKDGGIGDIIPIKNLKSSRIVEAKIISAGTAEIQF